jgi:hypothetical protein
LRLSLFFLKSGHGSLSVVVWPPAGITSFPSTRLHINFATNGNEAFCFLENQVHQPKSHVSCLNVRMKSQHLLEWQQAMPRRC